MWIIRAHRPVLMFYLPVQKKTRARISAGSSRAAISASLFTRWPFLIQECKACQPLTHIKPQCVKERKECMGPGKKKNQEDTANARLQGEKSENEE